VNGFDPAEPAATVNVSGAGSGIVADAHEPVTPEEPPPLAGEILIRSRDVTIEAGGRISTATTDTGSGGEIRIDADTVQVLGRGILSTDASGAGVGGTARITTGDLWLDQGIISASSSASFAGAGEAGDIVVHARRKITIEQDSSIRTSAAGSTGGDIRLSAGVGISLIDSEVTARAQGDGGNLVLLAPTVEAGEGEVLKTTEGATIYLSRSVVSAASVEGQGGNIVIDPEFVILSRSQLAANAVQGNGGMINIISDIFLESGSLITASSEFGLAGEINVSAPDLDLTSQISPLTVVLLGGEGELPDYCGRKLPGTLSSFVVSGPGGLPLHPDDWLPGLRLPARK